MDQPAFPPQFHPIVTAWFQRRFGEPSPPQQMGWPLIAARKNTLILAPTGSGKTLAAFLACIDALIHELVSGVQGAPPRSGGPGRSGIQEYQPAGPNTRTPERLNAGVRILYVSPLKALNYDIEKNLREPLAGLAEEAERQGLELPEIRVGVRTGDTRSKERQQMIRRPPHILITTPESLHLILTSQAKSMLETVQFLILDEIHALCNNKRGVFTSLLFERLEEAVATSVGGWGLGVGVASPNPRPPTPNPLVRIGLSATQRPLEEVARFLGGAEWEEDRLVPRPVEIVDAGMRKRLSLKVLCPVDDLAHMEAQTLWPGITRRLLSLLHDRKSTIVFANNRRQVERLTAQLNETAGEEIALPHHGSIAAPVRKITEERLKRGDVRAVCATGTLELGIDMGAVELVCQVESPRQVSKGLQRVGRAGHLMSAVSEGRILAKQPLDLLEAAVLAREMLAGRVETLRVPRNCLDVLAQQLVAIVADGERSLEELYRLVRRSYCYRDLPESQFQGTVAMISGRYPSHLFRDLRARVALDRVRGRLMPLPSTQRAALTNGGTIPDTGQFGVYTTSSRVKLGELDEEFIYESRVGDVFSLGIDTWRIDRIDADRVLVSPAPGSPARMPFWRGESYGREPELGQALGNFVAEVEARLDQPDVEEWIAGEVPVDDTGARNIAEYLRHGREKCGALPTHRTLLVESFEDEIGERRLAILSPLGRRVHLTLRLALAALIKEQYGVDPEALHNDDGLLLRLPGGEAELPLDLLRQVRPEEVWEKVVGQLASSPLFGLRFRQNAARALLLPGARPGKRSPLWLQRLKARDLLTVAGEYDDFPIVLETYRECLEEFLAIDTVRELLQGLRDGSVTAVENRRSTPSPFVATLLFDFQAIYMYEWDRPKGIGRGATEAQQRLVADLVGHLRSATHLLDPQSLAEREGRLQGTALGARARTPAEFLELLRRLGDLPAGGDAVASRYTGDPDTLLRDLCADRLVVQVCPGPFSSSTTVALPG